MHRVKKLCLREYSSLLINFTGKQKKNTPLLHVVLVFSHGIPQILPEVNTPMSD